MLIEHSFHTNTSPSSRRAWIEIADDRQDLADHDVALLAEGVDRNLHRREALLVDVGRPPRGGRG